MNTKYRPALVALAVSAIAVVVIAGATLRGETKEVASVADACSQAAWPLLPAQCLVDELSRQVRLIDIDAVTASKQKIADALQLRFAREFE